MSKTACIWSPITVQTVGYTKQLLEHKDQKTAVILSHVVEDVMQRRAAKYFPCIVHTSLPDFFFLYSSYRFMEKPYSVT